MSAISIDSKIYKILKESKKIQSIVGDEIYPIVKNTDKIDGPFIVYQKDSVTPTTVKGLSVADEVNFGFLIVFKNLDKTLEIAEIVRNLFELRQDNFFYRCDLTGTAEYYTNDMYCQELTFKAITTR
ncbi:hypothetical protein [Prevotella histicola]|uniref:hypothetical protein n=1 Tax=Prevotella histicola TaxID=470565 RepID=UPI0028F03ACA|nr:hypothetical protein [Prevotella histicola]